MAPRKASRPSTPPTPIPIGNCEVLIEANKYTCNSDSNSLEISINRNTKIRILVKEDTSVKLVNDLVVSNSAEEGEKERPSNVEDEFIFELANPKDIDGCTKSYLQEVLKLYTGELPTMIYAANTGKQSRFLERCVSKGKYCTLLLKSKSAEGFEKVVAAITYQIVPADTQYAEIPLAAVSSIYQHKGLGRLLYMGLKKRLQSVGIRTIFCWGDKESEGFWSKQGFVSIAEVDKKGRARRLPIKANIRKALCFPGGSTLMVSHLNKDSPGPAESLKFSLPMKTFQNLPSSAPDLSIGQREVDDAANPCSCSSQGAKRKVWEASLSSLKTKKVKGSHQIDCEIDSNCHIVPESDRSGSYFDGCSLAIQTNKSLVEVTPHISLISSCMENKADEDIPNFMMPEFTIDKELQSNTECFRIMLMNIADDTKKIHLTKVIENLGGSPASDGSSVTHVVTGRVRKTLNFCIALCSGAWIVSPSWLKESYREGKFVDESSYILHDEDYLSKYRTELKDAVLRARARPGALLKGYNFRIAAHVQPPVKTLSAIIRSAGGNIVSGPDKVNEAPETIFIACEEDMEEALLAVKKGISAFSSDWLMNCVMKQELDLDAPQFAESLSGDTNL